MSVYVEQYGYFWKLTAAQWLEVVKKALADETWDYNEIVRCLRRRPSVIARSVTDEGVSYYAKTNEHILVRPLDWNEETWLDEASNLGIPLPNSIAA